MGQGAVLCFLLSNPDMVSHHQKEAHDLLSLLPFLIEKVA